MRDIVCSDTAGSMDAVYPAAASALERGRRRRRACPRQRHHTVPVTFAEIKEVDEELLDAANNEACDASAGTSAGVEDRRRRPDVLEEGLIVTQSSSRRRRYQLREPDEMAITRALSNHSKLAAEPS